MIFVNVFGTMAAKVQSHAQTRSCRLADLQRKASGASEEVAFRYSGLRRSLGRGLTGVDVQSGWIYRLPTAPKW